VSDIYRLGRVDLDYFFTGDDSGLPLDGRG
jgi:hypothetical protein